VLRVEFFSIFLAKNPFPANNEHKSTVAKLKL
jgi:hypothetical protein